MENVEFSMLVKQGKKGKDVHEMYGIQVRENLEYTC